MPHDPFPPISAYGIIGDLRTVALLGPNGAVESMCFPHFDSPSIFAAHVDRKNGGRFQIEPVLDDRAEKQLYLPDTNVLITRFLSEDGVAEVSSFMALDEADEAIPQALVRRAKSVIGDVRFSLTFAPRFDYGRASHHVTALDAHTLLFESDQEVPLRLLLHSSVPLEIRNRDGAAEFLLLEGEHASFIMREANAPDAASCGHEGYSADAFKRTCNFWRRWIGRCHYNGRWRESVHRAALALKLLTSRQYGSIIAAPCFGFPNEIGGVRNWDYRYTWLRDASFSTYALMRLGYTEEAGAFMKWLEDRITEDEDDATLKTMYRIDGSDIDGEVHLDHFEGYRHSRPVRIGSTNHDQKQLDIYGEVMDSIELFDATGSPISHRLWRNIRELANHVCRHAHEADASIWEVRSENRHFLYSRIMSWVALDRAIRLTTKRGLPGPVADWQKSRDAIYEEVFDEFWDPDQGAFVQFKGGTALDASSLVMPLVRMISPTDPQWLQHLDALSHTLVHDSLVDRYRVGEAFSDCLEGKEGSFSICSFWYIECVSRSGDLQRARLLFEKMLGYASPLGLFSEQLGKRGECLGNIPQAFSHLAMISAAFELDHRLNEEPSSRISGGKG
ncbi:GH15 family glucan-1,4-alpha-glucosidase [Haloferula luteola]|uniref:GH15 family glucan-1,4-alpha-glucosidase n=1 Tax=Haloferula luteola TaxID=595692 RepID=A0A840VEF1_9BACT|nr:glycoside hydrolase family 15 protein [Haloferula luteola]MBB5351211.1 GH15 family glucan-1,4-alpha-glucosidase [Haloferula luteola]